MYRKPFLLKAIFFFFFSIPNELPDFIMTDLFSIFRDCILLIMYIGI